MSAAAPNTVLRPLPGAVAPITTVIEFQPSRDLPRRLAITWNRHHMVVSIFARRCEHSLAYTSVPHADARLDVMGSEVPSYQLWVGATMFEISYSEYQVLRERLGPLGLRYRGERS